MCGRSSKERGPLSKAPWRPTGDTTGKDLGWNTEGSSSTTCRAHDVRWTMKCAHLGLEDSALQTCPLMMDFSHLFFLQARSGRESRAAWGSFDDAGVMYVVQARVCRVSEGKISPLESWALDPSLMGSTLPCAVAASWVPAQWMARPTVWMVGAIPRVGKCLDGRSHPG